MTPPLFQNKDSFSSLLLSRLNSLPPIKGGNFSKFHTLFRSYKMSLIVASYSTSSRYLFYSIDSTFKYQSTCGILAYRNKTELSPIRAYSSRCFPSSILTNPSPSNTNKSTSLISFLLSFLFNSITTGICTYKTCPSLTVSITIPCPLNLGCLITVLALFESQPFFSSLPLKSSYKFSPPLEDV